MNSYEFSVKKTLLGTFTVEAENSQDAYLKVRDHAKRIVLVNNMSPWTQEIVHANMIDTTEGEA